MRHFKIFSTLYLFDQSHPKFPRIFTVSVNVFAIDGGQFIVNENVFPFAKLPNFQSDFARIVGSG